MLITIIFFRYAGTGDASGSHDEVLTFETVQEHFEEHPAPTT